MRQRRRNRGLSILEVMVVLGIMALIMAIAAPRVIGFFGRAKAQTATIELQQIKGALEFMYLDIGRFPSEAEGLQLLVQQPAGLPSWQGPYLETEDAIRDPWGRPYIYRIPGENRAFDLLTLGRDGTRGGTGEDADKTL